MTARLHVPAAAAAAATAVSPAAYASVLGSTTTTTRPARTRLHPPFFYVCASLSLLILVLLLEPAFAQFSRGGRHWITLIPPARQAALTLDDAKIIAIADIDPAVEENVMIYDVAPSGAEFNYGIENPVVNSPTLPPVVVDSPVIVEEDVVDIQQGATSTDQDASQQLPSGTYQHWVDPPGFPTYPTEPVPAELVDEAYFDYSPGCIKNEDTDTFTDAATTNNGAGPKPALTYIGDEEHLKDNNLGLGRCQGDCDTDDDCDLNLVCHQRSDLSQVPGCSGQGQEGTDYCVRTEDDGNGKGEFVNDNCHGPAHWYQVTASQTLESDYWSQFQDWIDPSLRRNVCNGAMQSPIDVRFDDATAECFEYHNIRHKEGEYGVEHDWVEKQILPNKLRLVYKQVYDDEQFEDGIGGPSADMPKGWGYQLPVTHVDIKIPSEHYLHGKQYAAEYQIFIIQNRDAQRGAPAVSVLFDLHPQDVPNKPLQRALDQFQLVFDADMSDCEAFRRRQQRMILEALAPQQSLEGSTHRNTEIDEAEAFYRRMGAQPSPVDTEVMNNRYDWSDEDDEQLEARRSTLRRQAQEDYIRKWDPWHEDIVTSKYFFGYEGSLTEPPCTEFISWRIIDSPAYVSRSQLLQMKELLFNHVDGQCRKTSTHSNGNVARPLQPLNGRDLWQCTCRDYVGDDEREWYGRNRCWESDEHVFHERTKDGRHWMSNPATKPDMAAGAVYNCNHQPDLLPPCCGKDYDPYHGCCARNDCKLRHEL